MLDLNLAIAVLILSIIFSGSEIALISANALQINVWVKTGKIESDKSKVFFGSREVDDSIVEKKIYRYLLGSILNSFIKILFKFNIKDTQCGFKLYKSDHAKKVFKKLKMLRFAHDIELIVMIYKMN